MPDPVREDAPPRSRSDYPGTPVWVKLFALATLGLLLVVVLVLVVGTALGLHSPMGHGG